MFWGGELGEQVAVRGWTHHRDHVLGTLKARAGEPVPVAGTGEAVPLNLNHPLAVVAALVACGEIWSFGGDLPPGWRGEAPAESV